MRRIALIAPTALAAVVCALLPSAALAHGHHHRHHHRAHGAWHHGRFHAVGRMDGSATGTRTGSTGASSDTGTPPGTEHVSPPPGNPQGNAGTVVSYTEGVLTIKLGEGEKATTIAGNVTAATEIHCIPASALSRSGESGSPDPGDDNGWSGGQGQQSGEPGTTHEDDQGAGDDQDGGDRNLEGGEQHCQCSTTNLTPGAVVHSAELRLDTSGAVFREIVLVVG